MDLAGDTLELSRERSTLDEAVIEFTALLESWDVSYVIVSGYVAILTGRTRATEDVDIILERLTVAEVDDLVEAFTDNGYWGMAMPLDDMYSMLDRGSRIRVAEDGELYPNFELWFESNELEQEALANPVTAVFDDDEIAISPIELQIAYKLHLAQSAGSLTGKDFEDALHLYLTFEEQFNRGRLEGYVDTLGVEDYYGELTAI